MLPLDVSGGAAPLLAALSLGLGAAENVTRLINSKLHSTPTRPPATAKSTSADASEVKPVEVKMVLTPSEPKELSEQEVMKRILDQYCDADWKKLAKVRCHAH